MVSENFLLFPGLALQLSAPVLAVYSSSNPQGELPCRIALKSSHDCLLLLQTLETNWLGIGFGFVFPSNLKGRRQD